MELFLKSACAHVIVLYHCLISVLDKEDVCLTKKLISFKHYTSFFPMWNEMLSVSGLAMSQSSGFCGCVKDQFLSPAHSPSVSKVL